MPRWPSPDPNSWANPRGRKKGKGTTTKARQARRAVSPRVVIPCAPREKGSLGGGVLQAKGQPLQQGQVQLDPLREGRKGSKRVLCLDWHNVFQIKEGWKDVVPDRHINKIWDLQAEQWEIHLISFCGQKRAQEVEDWARSLPIKWASVRCIRERCGPGPSILDALLSWTTTDISLKKPCKKAWMCCQSPHGMRSTCGTGASPSTASQKLSTICS